jgi:hypothetical protein
VSEPGATLDELVTELEAAAARLRSGGLEPVDAAGLVDRCAQLAARVGSELDGAGRAAESGGGEGQGTLL